jgi:beta-lactamase superfamily II metal-dependent hydrolase
MILLFLMLFLVLEYRNQRLRKRLVCTILLVADLILWTGVIQNPSAKLTWIQFDVGQGDAALIRTPEGRVVLIDSGGKTEYSDCGEKTIAPYLIKNGIRRLDAVVLTHPHNDHSGGLDYLIAHFKIGEIVATRPSGDSDADWRFLKQAETCGVPVRIADECDSLTVSRSVKITVFNLSRRLAVKSVLNEQSLVTLVRFGKVKWLFMGDAGAPSEMCLAGYPVLVGCDAIKIGHHGSRHSSSWDFLLRVRPKQALISVGENNRFGHPSPEVIQRLQSVGAQIHRTDREGAVIFQTDGLRSWRVGWQ